MTTAPAPAPGLTRLGPPAPCRGVVLMLHGGRQRSTQAVDGRSASWRRSSLMQRSITSRTHDAGVATWLLRFRERGWNGGTAPVEDARWALEQVRREHGGVPVVLLGHSMGARASVYVADDESVVGVVGLAPWLSPSDPVHGLAGRHLVAAHGHRDRITSPRATAAYVERAARVAASAEMVDMGPVGHYMFKRVAAWNDLAAARSLALIAGAG